MSNVDNNYSYFKNIKTPDQLGMTPGSSLSNISDGVAGLVNYVNLLVEGTSPASVTGKPLGNKYIIATNQKCSSPDGDVTRSLYFDNIPSGSLGLMDSGMGSSFTEFKGLIPGALEDVISIAKLDFFSAFTSMEAPKCVNVELKTIGIDNSEGQEKAYIALEDLNDISPCNFTDGYNPGTKVSCDTQGFTVHDVNNTFNSTRKRKNKKKNKDLQTPNKNSDLKLKMPDDIFLRIMFYSFGAFWVYVILKLLSNMYKKRS
jgi:hypothetical protein